MAARREEKGQHAGADRVGTVATGEDGRVSRHGHAARTLSPSCAHPSFGPMIAILDALEGMSTKKTRRENLLLVGISRAASVGAIHGDAHRSTNLLTETAFRFTFNHMIESEAHLDALFHALGDPTRRQMLRDLAEGERTVGQLAEPFAISLAAASKHIKALEGAGLIRREIRWRTHVCRLNPGPLAEAHAWLGFYERFWTDRLSVLDELLRKEGQAPGPAPAPKPEGERQ